MTVFKRNVHLGTKDPLIETDDIDNKAITTEKIDDGAVTSEKIAKGGVEWENVSKDVQNIIASMEKGGVALSGEFGDSELIGINQKKVTETVGPEGVITQKVATLEEAVGEGGSVDERIAVETNRAQAAEELLREAYESLSQSQPIPKTAEEWAAMTSWEEGVIYRVAGTTSYTDYMYNGTTTIPMATYNNAIDNEPTAGSDNLVKSGGVYENTFDVNHALGHINKLIGTGSTVDNVTITPVLEHVYQLEMLDTDWSIEGTGTAGSNSIFYLAGYGGSSYNIEIENVKREQWDTVKPASKYIFRWKENLSTNGTLRLGIRAAVGTEIRYRLTDVTADYKDTVVGVNTGYTSIRYDNLINGHTYRISLKNTEWQYDKTSGGTSSAKFAVDSFVDETNYVNLVKVAKSATLNDTYEFTVPEDSSYIEIGGRANNGEAIRFQLEDIRLQEEIEEKTTPQEVQTIFKDSLPHNLEGFTLMNNKGNVAFDSNTNSTVASTSDTQNFDYRKVRKGDLFKVYAISGSTTESGNLVGVYMFDEAPVSEGISGEILYQYKVNVENPLDGAIIEIPKDGYMAIYIATSPYGAYIRSYCLVKISNFDDIFYSNNYIEEKYDSLNIPITPNVVIDCTEGSETFGQEVTVVDNNQNYGCSDYIDLTNIKYISVQAGRTGASAYWSILHTWSCGSVFYDENKQPFNIPENIPVESRGYSSGNKYEVYNVLGSTSRNLLKVPEGAKYLRVTSYIGGDVKVADISLFIKKETDIIDTPLELLRQAQWVKQRGVTASSLTLLHFSDIHGNTDAADKLKEEMTKYAGLINDNLCTGDVCQQAYNSTNIVSPGSSAWTYGDEATHGHRWWTEITGLAERCLFVLGNHDGATSATTEYDKKEDSAAWDGIGKDADYNLYFAPFAQQLGITQPEGVGDPESPNYHACYWHKDYTAQKIRLIGIDCMHRYDGLLDENGNPITDSWVKHATMEQEIWLKNILAETLDAENDSYGYSVLFACHYPLDDSTTDNKEWSENEHEFIYNHNNNGGRVFSHKTNDPVNFTSYDITDISSALKFNLRNRVANSSTIGYSKGTENHIGDIISSWINAGGKCIAWISGHYHNDYLFYTAKYPNIPVIAIDKTGYYTAGGSDYNNRNTDKSMLCANLYVIDTQNGYFKIIRLGVNTNKQLISKKHMCYDYINRKVLSEG